MNIPYMQYQTIGIAGNGTAVIAMNGNCFGVFENDSATAVKVSFRDNIQYSQEYDFPAGVVIEMPQNFIGEIVLRNSTGSTMTVKIGIMQGRITDNRMSVTSALQVNASGNSVATIAAFTTSGTAAEKAPPTGTIEQIIQNNGSNTCYIGDANVSTTRGYKLEAGDAIIISSSASIYFIDDATNHTDINITYNKKV